MNDIKNTKVLLLTDIYAPYKEPLLTEISKYVDLTVYYTKDIIPIRNWDIKFSNKYKYEILPGSYINIKHFHIYFNPIIINKLKKEKFDAIIVGGYSYPTVQMALIASKLLGTKIILWSGTTSNEKHTFRFLFYPVKKFFISLCDRYVSYSSFAKQYLVDFGVDKDLIDVAPITIDTDKFINNNKVFDKGTTKLIFVGRLDPVKGVMDLIDVMDILRDEDIELNIIGKGVQYEDLLQRIKELSLESKVNLLGHRSQDDLKELYYSSDIFILPSTYEPSGNVINEAMASGLPTITTDIIGNDAVEHTKTGFVVKTHDSESIAKYIKELMKNDKALIKEMSKYNVNRIKNFFSIQYEALQFAKAIEKLD